MIDIVYAIGGASRWNDNELRYSLRSVDKYLSNVRDIYIIGDKPDFVQNVIHIPFKDEHFFKERRICLKLLEACENKNISEDFLFFNDDHFALKPMNAEDVPYYYDNTLANQIKSFVTNSPYKICLLNLYNQLSDKLLPDLFFDTHTPIIYNKEKFIEAEGAFDWEYENSLVIKSMYCNYHELSGQEIKDLKIKKDLPLDQLRALIEGRDFFSIGDLVWANMNELLESLYPEKSRYEKSI